ncbi:MAG: tRNA preQ1(34) S-adenosylmethionine ribosyltransferase-isomerase QueA [Pseudomonadota bacterium]
MLTSDFDYDLPEQLIANYPKVNRSDSRLLVYDPNQNAIAHRQFKQLDAYLNTGDVLVLNDTKVVPARLKGSKQTGGQVEIMLERMIDDQHILAKAKSSKALQPGQIVTINDKVGFAVCRKQGEFYVFVKRSELDLLAVFEQYGHMPLPPYIKREDDNLDKIRYQTIFAKKAGAVAAPTASLHFDTEVFAALKRKGVEIVYITLHVGAGTYEPVRVQAVKEHKMHQEWMEISANVCAKIIAAKQQGKKIIAAGTTVLRALESACLSGNIEPYRGETDIFIYPGFKFNCVDKLITNFHLPGSTLLMLVAAFAGQENILALYNTAITLKYQFFSYGDAMLLTKEES